MGNNKIKLPWVIGAFEFFIAAILILKIKHDPNSGFLFGYSLPRIFLVSITLLLGISLLVVAIKYNEEIEKGLYEKFQKRNFTWSYIGFSFFLAGWTIWLVPVPNLGLLSYYFEPFRPLLVVICILPLQIILRWIFKDRNKFNLKLTIPALIICVLSLSIIVIIAVTKLGISPDPYYWNVAGMPLTSFQFVFIFLITFNLTYLIAKLQKQENKKKQKYINIIIFMLLYIGTVIIWFNTPMLKHYFSVEPSPPNFQPFPFSDARNHDLGAISIINGWGINFGEYTDKPFYMSVLAFIHLISRNDYLTQTFLQILLLAFIVPVLFVFGKIFHSRFFGIFIALTVLIRQKNAIELSYKVASVNPRLFVTEVLTLLGLLLVVYLLFSWANLHKKKALLSFLVGCVLGVTSLVRLNPVSLLPVIPIFMFFVLWKNKKAWFLQVISFLAGFMLLISPWLLIGQDINGTPYFFIKFKDVMYSRYSISIPQNESIDLALDMNQMKQFSNGHAKLISQIDVGSDASLFDIHEFPGFVINHFLHNLIGAFLVLPDSLIIEDQDLMQLAQRPYWQEEETANWGGELGSAQLFFIGINLVLVSFGLGWSWKRWKLGGLIPLMIFFAYCLSLGFARNSGSRYLVPIDWIVYFYYILGIIYIFTVLFNDLSKNLDMTDAVGNELKTNMYSQKKKRINIPLVLILFSFLLIPLSNIYNANNSPLCEIDITPDKTNQIDMEALPENTILETGQILYPTLINNEINAYFLSCEKYRPIKYIPENNYFNHGDLVIIGSDSNKSTTYIEIILPLNNE